MTPIPPEEPTPPAETRSWWARNKDAYRALLEEYGGIAIGTYLTIFFGTLIAFTVAIRLGFEPESAAGRSGTLVIAYAATKAIQPLRIAATLVATPFVARIARRFRRSAPASAESTDPPG